MSDAASTDPAAPNDASPPETIFYLDEGEATEIPLGRWGFHGRDGSQLPRFLLVGCALLLLCGVVLGVAFEGWAFLRENYWAPLLWIGLAVVVYRLSFRQRPFFQIAPDGLAFCLNAHRAERRIAWEDLERVDLEPDSGAALVLHHTTSGPVYLYFSSLSEERTQTLKDTLVDAARTQDVAVT